MMSLERMSSFFWSSPWTLAVPAAPILQTGVSSALLPRARVEGEWFPAKRAGIASTRLQVEIAGSTV